MIFGGNRLWLLGLLCLLVWPLFATHNRAGEITYTWVSGLTYEFTITTYTKESAPADRCELEIVWGDGSSSVFQRINGLIGTCPSPARMGEILPGDFKLNRYRGQHTFAAPGIYTITVEDQNRNAGVSNIPVSVNVPFFIQTVLRINPQLGPNNSVQLLNPPVDDGCVNRTYIHNPGSFDPDGDSLGYQLVNCRGAAGLEIIQTYDPVIVQNPVLVDNNLGQLVWDTPQNQGQYNFALLISEYRKNSSGSWEFIGSVTRDLQVDIGVCNNLPPTIDPLGPFCVVAGQNLNFQVTARDPDGNNVVLTASGGPFVVDNPATFIQPVSGPSPLTANFLWMTNCSHVRLQPYTIVFKVKDIPSDPNDPALVGFQNAEIQVIAPAPQNPLALSVSGGINLQWDTSLCQQAIGYRLYRRKGGSGFVPGFCETGVPPSAGYRLIAELNGLGSTSYFDDDSLEAGNLYCYRVIAFFADGSESVASVEFCAGFTTDSPLMLKVDITETDAFNGEIALKWMPPLAIDSALFPANYGYLLYRGTGLNPTVFDTIARLLAYGDTVLMDQGLDTENNAHAYYVRLLYGKTPNSGFLLGPESNPASSVRLSVTPGDELNALSWKASTPWLNERYVVFRETNPGSGVFDSLAETDLNFYIDPALTNGDLYCYKVKAIGRYTLSGYPEPLVNYSQEACATPIDTTLPCPPTLAASYNCEAQTLVLNWGTDNPICPNDIAFYNLYFKPDEESAFPSTPFATNITETFFDAFDGELIGCFAVSAVDDASTDPNGLANESALSNTVCVESCPLLVLPNVFTPNEDGNNEWFTAVREQGRVLARGIESFEIQIFNRWGSLVYESQSLETFIETGWDGTDAQSGQACAEGVYYYVAAYRAKSIRPVGKTQLKGFVHLFR